MKISDLIKELKWQLEGYGDLEVMTSCDAFDLNHTEILNNIENFKIIQPIETYYGTTCLAVPDENQKPKENTNEKVLVLSYKEFKF